MRSYTFKDIGCSIDYRVKSKIDSKVTRKFLMVLEIFFLYNNFNSLQKLYFPNKNIFSIIINF